MANCEQLRARRTHFGLGSMWSWLICVVALAMVAAVTGVTPGTTVSAQAADGYVYWANYGSDTIGRADLDGTGVDQDFITAAAGPVAVAVNTTYVYWTNASVLSDTIGRANLNGTGVDQDFITGANRPAGIAIDNTKIYWSSLGSEKIERSTLTGTNRNSSFITGTQMPIGVAVDGSYVYWANADGNTIGRANLNGTGVDQDFITGASVPIGVAVDNTYVYWTNTAAGSVGRANLNGTGVDQDFITGAAAPEGVEVNGTHVYWANTSGNTIGRANLNGTGVDQNFITGATSPREIALTAEPPDAPSSVTYSPKRGKKHTRVQWAGAVDATGYQVFVGGKRKCSTEADTSLCLLRKRYGPDANVKVRSLGDGGTASAKVNAKFRRNAQPVKLGTVHFPPNSAVLSKHAKQRIRKMANLLAAQGFRHVTLTGYTAHVPGTTGSAAFRRQLSRERAQAVRTILNKRLDKLGADVRVHIRAKGRKDPADSNKTEPGRKRNRRATIALT